MVTSDGGQSIPLDQRRMRACTRESERGRVQWHRGLLTRQSRQEEAAGGVARRGWLMAHGNSSSTL